jgi:ABC-type Zn uptake system ZnuABC Zn-binding protein ZnuA
MKKRNHWLFVALGCLSMLLFTLGGCGRSAATTTTKQVEKEAATEREHEGEYEREGEAENEHEHEVPSLSPVPLDDGERLKVVATTSIVADVVRNVGGDQIELAVLLPLGADPHSFEPTPQNIAAVSDAHVVFANGVGLEGFLEPLLESAGAMEKAIHVSHGIELLQFEGENADEVEDEHEHERGGADPHTWTDPNNVIVWTHNIDNTLSALDPANAATYKANAEAYVAALEGLDAWVREQVAQIPEPDRQIVTDHLFFAYFADRYGFTQVGALVPAYSTLAEPSAKELADLEDAIRDLGVKAVFVGRTTNPNLARRVSEDMGMQLIFVYTGSLTEKGGDADNYIDYVRYNVEAFVSALK